MERRLLFVIGVLVVVLMPVVVVGGGIGDPGDGSDVGNEVGTALDSVVRVSIEEPGSDRRGDPGDGDEAVELSLNLGSVRDLQVEVWQPDFLVRLFVLWDRI